MMNVFFAHLTFPFLMQLLPINSFRFVFLLKVVIGSSWSNPWSVLLMFLIYKSFFKLLLMVFKVCFFRTNSFSSKGLAIRNIGLQRFRVFSVDVEEYLTICFFLYIFVYLLFFMFISVSRNACFWYLVFRFNGFLRSFKNLIRSFILQIHIKNMSSINLR